MGAETVNLLARKNGYSIAKAEELLGWTPLISLEEGLQRTETYLREKGVI